MDQPSVFYSWQSDRPARVTRELIESALQNVLTSASGKLHVDLVLDQDLRSESGSPKIAETIQEKIRRAAVFVGDLTIVARREKGGGLLNSNVSIEWGWAQEALGPGALVGVMNTRYGSPTDLPVDIRQALVKVTYGADENSSDSELEGARRALEALLEEEVIAVVRNRFFRDFHEDAPRVVECLVRISPEGRSSSHSFGPADIAAHSRVSSETASASLEDLVRFGLAEEAGGLGRGFQIRPLMSLYVHFDPLYMGWNANRDAVVVARELVRRESVRLDQLSQDLGWPPRRMNPAVFRLLQYGFADEESALGSSPFYRQQISRNANTRAFAESRARLGPVAPRAQSRID